jgi:hypothetical protein
MKDITKESLIDLFYKLFVEENKVPSYYLELDPNCENIEEKHSGVSDEWVSCFFELVGVDYWDVHDSNLEKIPLEIEKHLEKQIKIINDIIKNFGADKNFYETNIPNYSNLFLKQLEYLESRIFP